MSTLNKKYALAALKAVKYMYMQNSYLKLLDGYRKFKKDSVSKKEFFSDLHLGQNAQILVISCCDSRVVPNIIMQAEPGEMFITRNIAGLVPPYDHSHTSYHATSAAIEYAVLALKVKHIIIMGHTRCGGIAALVKSNGKHDTKTDFIGKWMEIALPAMHTTNCNCEDKSFDHKCSYCEKEALKVSLKNLLTFPAVKCAVENKQTQIHAMLFDIKQCTLSEYNPQKDTFEELV